jgi:hypothetical protein
MLKLSMTHYPMPFYEVHEDSAYVWINKKLLENHETAHIKIECYPDFPPQPAPTSNHFMARTATLYYDENLIDSDGALRIIDGLYEQWKQTKPST